MKQHLLILTLLSVLFIACSKNGNDVVEKQEIKTQQATSITPTSITISGSIPNSSATVTARGMCWNKQPNPTTANEKTVDGSGTGSFTSTITGLKPATTYYIRAYGETTAGTIYGDVQTINTLSSGPEVTTNTVTEVWDTSAKFGGNVIADGGSAVTARGVCWDTLPDPTVDDDKTVDGSGTGTFTTSVLSLKPATWYYVRAYATNAEGTSYGNVDSFRTMKKPNVGTSPLVGQNNPTTTTANCQGTVFDDYGSPVTEKGIVWSTMPNPTKANNKKVSGSGLGEIAVTLTNLTTNTTYYYRAYAINALGTSYGEQYSFNTQANFEIVTLPVTDFWGDGFNYYGMAHGRINSTGGYVIVKRGICFSKNTTQPTVLSEGNVFVNPDANPNSTSTYDLSLGALTLHSAYYIRAYAVDSYGGVHYGNIIQKIVP